MTTLSTMIPIALVAMLAVVLSATSVAARKCGAGGAMFNAPVYVWGGLAGSPLLAELERGLRSEGGDVPCLMSRLSSSGVPFVAVAASSADMEDPALVAKVVAARAASEVSGLTFPV